MKECPHLKLKSTYCTLCISKIVIQISNELLKLGPRTLSQYDALVQRLSCDIEGVRTQLYANYAVRQNDRVVHVAHAFAEHVAAAVIDPTPITDIAYISPAVRDMFAAHINTNAYIQSVVDVMGNPRGTQLVCAKNSMGAHDIETLERAIMKAGTAGICRKEIGGQYRLAYMDLTVLIDKLAVFATTYRVWHRTIAGQRDKQLSKAAKAAGLIL